MSLFRRRRADRVEDEESFADLAEDATADDATGSDAPGRRGTRTGDARPAVDDEQDDGSDDDSEDLGPYDIDDAPDDGLERLDLGSLKIPALSGVEVQIQANDQGQVAAVALISGPSAVQLGVFAAPRSEGIWDEVRTELAESLKTEGSAVTEVDGEYGTELRGRIKAPNGTQDVRFVGVDGPRWFVRAVFHGAVATDPSAAPELVDCLRKIIVDRGKDAMPVRDPLPLNLPAEAVQNQQAAANGDGGSADGADRSGSDRR
ncbi:MAG: DUF3710 domain-containing protein [Actinocatenispora sp.]